VIHVIHGPANRDCSESEVWRVRVAFSFFFITYFVVIGDQRSRKDLQFGTVVSARLLNNDSPLRQHFANSLPTLCPPILLVSLPTFGLTAICGRGIV